jgi:hypothetical protein
MAEKNQKKIKKTKNKRFLKKMLKYEVNPTWTYNVARKSYLYVPLMKKVFTLKFPTLVQAVMDYQILMTL